MNSLTSAYNRMVRYPRINPRNPEEVIKLRKQIEKSSGGRRTIKTIDETEGMGIYSQGIDPAGYGYTIVETETEKQRSNPNSEEFKRESARRRQEAIDEEMRRKARMRKL